MVIVLKEKDIKKDKDLKILLEEDAKKAKKKRTRKRKRTKSQEEYRIKLLSQIINKWVCVKEVDEDEERYTFLYHRIPDGTSTSKIEQIILSGDDLQDGLYLITDYEIDIVFDKQSRKEIIQLFPKKYDLKMGKFAEDDITDSIEELKEKLIGAKYLTEDEFEVYCQSSYKPFGVEEIRLAHEEFNQEKEW